MFTDLTLDELFQLWLFLKRATLRQDEIYGSSANGVREDVADIIWEVAEEIDARP